MLTHIQDTLVSCDRHAAICSHIYLAFSERTVVLQTGETNDALRSVATTIHISLLLSSYAVKRPRAQNN